MKKKCAYFMAISPNLAFAAGNVAIGINKYLKNEDFDIVIYHSGISDDDSKAMKKIPHVVLKYYKLDEDFVQHMIEKLPTECRFRSRDRLMCFAHFEAFALLDEYQYVVWMDSDVLVQESIDDICQYGPIGLQADTPHSVGNQFVSIPDANYKYDIEAIRVGLMVFSDELPYKILYRWCFDKAIEFAQYLKNPEQAVINLMLQEFAINPHIIPAEYHCDCREKEAVMTHIVHFGTEEKVWNKEDILVAYPEWFRNHEKWKLLGGSVSNDFTLIDYSPRPPFSSKEEILFPFGEIPFGSSIILYGWGRAGRIFFSQIKRLDYCNVVAIADKRKYTYENGKTTIFPETIADAGCFDYIVISIRNKEMAMEVKKELCSEYGILEGKIVW